MNDISGIHVHVHKNKPKSSEKLIRTIPGMDTFKKFILFQIFSNWGDVHLTIISIPRGCDNHFKNCSRSLPGYMGHYENQVRSYAINRGSVA